MTCLPEPHINFTASADSSTTGKLKGNVKVPGTGVNRRSSRDENQNYEISAKVRFLELLISLLDC